MKLLGWVYFAIIQLISLVAMVLGWLVLIAPCVLQAWEFGGKSIKDGRPIDQWKWAWLRLVFHNPEDGDSGQAALVWVNGMQGPYLPQAGPRWRAYRWSALRNSADGLKYLFAWRGGPYVTRDVILPRWLPWVGGRILTLQAGWQIENGVTVPVLSL